MLHEKRKIYCENYYAIVLLRLSIESHVYLFNLYFLIFGWCNGALIQIKTVEKNLILNDKHDMTCCCWLRVWFFRWQCRRTWKWWKPRGLVWSGERKGLKGISSTIRGYLHWYSQVSHTQIHKHKYTNTQIQHMTKCQKDPTCGIFLKRGLIEDI